MLPLNLKQLKAEHVQQLIDNATSETLILEYKRDLPSDKSDDKKKFLLEVAGLANAAGGDIVIGIIDKKTADANSAGIAAGLSGIELPNPQREIDRLSAMIRDNVAPRLAGVTIEAVALPDGAVVVVRVPRSWNKPHMVTLEGTNKFYGRVGTMKYPLSVEEIGRAFSEGGELREQVERWRLRRVELTLNQKGPVRLAGLVTFLFHVIPSSAFARNILRESWILSDEDKSQIYAPCGGTSKRYNADGFVVVASTGTKFEGHGYTQLFRSGIAEYANSNIFGPTAIGSRGIWGQQLEQALVYCYEDAIKRLRRHGWAEPVFVALSLLGIAGKSFYSTAMRSLGKEHSENVHDVFNSPEVMIDLNEPEERPYPKALLPIVDTMWQIGGYEGSPFRTDDGRWEPFKNYGT